MDVLGHDHITCHDELVFLAGLLKHFQKNIAMPSGSEKRKSAIARARNEMPIALSINADQSFRHRLILYPTLWA